ncbi:MAG TPA: type VI secretion system baseplate subunit TssK [Gemmataceae bacterium]|nr:type VI secretion system baseplate subunit TssK [Gemmataceae bacterium]
MTSRAVHWHNEMFIRPHHFQASYRYLVDLGRRNHNWDLHYNWGLRSLTLDPKALENHQLVVQALEARLPDGTPVSIPRDGTLARVDLRRSQELREARQFLVYLAVPPIRPGRANAPAQRQTDSRYFQESVNLEDENTGGNAQPIVLRAPNFQLLVGNQDRAGYHVLPIARIEKADQAAGGLQVDPTYIPPLLSCDAWPPLLDGILRALHDRLYKKIDWITQLSTRQGVTWDRNVPGDLLVLKQMQQLFEAVSVLGVLIAARGVHPLTAFLELSRVVGQMAIFGATRRPPELPRYDHDDLGTCFAYLKQHLDTQLNLVVEPEYKERPFIGAGWRMQVTLEPAWMDPSAQIFIGVQSTLETQQCVELLTQAGQLDMKIGSSDRVEDLFRQGAAGLRFVAESLPPQELPKVAGQTYFQVIQDAKNPEWLNVKKTLTLALRLNENLIVGNIQNQRLLTIKVGGRNVSMQFTLYVLLGK